MSKVCPQCGVSFQTTNPRQVYCRVECRVKHWRATQRAKAVKETPERPYTPPPRQPDVIIPNKKSLLDLNFQEVIKWISMHYRKIPDKTLSRVYEDWSNGTLTLTAPSKEEEKRDRPLTDTISDKDKAQLQKLLDELAQQTASKGSV